MSSNEMKEAMSGGVIKLVKLSLLKTQFPAGSIALTEFPTD